MLKRFLKVLGGTVAMIFVPYYIGIGLMYVIKKSAYEAESVLREKDVGEIYGLGLWVLVIACITGLMIYLAVHYIKTGK